MERIVFDSKGENLKYCAAMIAGMVIVEKIFPYEDRLFHRLKSKRAAAFRAVVQECTVLETMRSPSFHRDGASARTCCIVCEGARLNG